MATLLGWLFEVSDNVGSCLFRLLINQIEWYLCACEKRQGLRGIAFFQRRTQVWNQWQLRETRSQAALDKQELW